MGGFSIWHWLVVGVIILLLFGKGRFSDMMGDVAKGIKSFKKGMTEDEEAEAERKLEAQRRLSADRLSADRPADLPPETSRTADPLDRREP
jgi:sec-independent protein translocase protein TatA